MADKKKFKPELKGGLWVVIGSPEAARWAVKQAVAAAVFCTVATAGVAIWAHYSPEMAARTGLNIWALFDAFIFLAIAIGLYFNSRVAAVAGLAFYLFERAMALPSTPPSAWIVIAILIMGFIGGVRGTFAHHRFAREAPVPMDAPIQP